MAKGTGIHIIKNGVQVELTAKQVKSYIMKVNKWTSEQYNKQYDILRNKLRSYEAFKRASGEKVEKQSVSNLLYKEARTMKREGKNYKPSIKLQRIKGFTSISTGKVLQKALKSEYYLRQRNKEYTKATRKQFGGLIEHNEGAKAIFKAIKDPVKREQALVEYANQLKLKITESGKVEEGQAIPTGETFGSDDSIDVQGILDEYLA